jgi:transposase
VGLAGDQAGRHRIPATSPTLFVLWRDYLCCATHRAWLWTFIEQEGVEPTNNTAERVLRHAVIWRKLSFGTQSSSGSRFVERMLTTIETCRLQKRSVFDYLTAAVEAHLAKQPAPSLLPTS